MANFRSTDRSTLEPVAHPTRRANRRSATAVIRGRYLDDWTKIAAGRPHMKVADFRSRPLPVGRAVGTAVIRYSTGRPRAAFKSAGCTYASIAAVHTSLQTRGLRSPSLLDCRLAQGDRSRSTRAASKPGAHQRYLQPKMITHSFAKLVHGIEVGDLGGAEAPSCSQVIDSRGRKSKDFSSGRQFEAAAQ
jgi:hypothetical protein